MTDRPPLQSRFRRYPRRGYVAGVCAGVALAMDWNVKLIRLLTVLAVLFSGLFPAGLIYAALWYLMDPAEGEPQAAPAARGHGCGASEGDVARRFERMEQRLRRMEDCVTSREYELRRELRKLES